MHVLCMWRGRDICMYTGKYTVVGFSVEGFGFRAVRLGFKVWIFWGLESRVW